VWNCKFLLILIAITLFLFPLLHCSIIVSMSLSLEKLINCRSLISLVSRQCMALANGYTTRCYLIVFHSSPINTEGPPYYWFVSFTYVIYKYCISNVVTAFIFSSSVTHAHQNWLTASAPRKNVAWKSTKIFYFTRKIRNFSVMGLLMGCGTCQVPCTAHQQTHPPWTRWSHL
jgi:hypothetical protein